MAFSDIILLATAYAAYAASVWGVSYGAYALWAFFKSISTADFKD